MTAPPSWAPTRDGAILATLGLGVLVVWTTTPRLALLTFAVTTVTLAGCAIAAVRGSSFGPTRVLHTLAKAIGVTWGVGIVGGWVFASPPTTLGIVLVLASLVGAGAWLVKRRPRPPTIDAAAPWTDDETLERAVTTATDQQLRELWQRSDAVLRHSYLPSSIGRYTEIRRLVLDEAERRAPDQVSQWLADDPRSDTLPDYLRKS